MRRFGTVLVTGGCGFIGSNFVRSAVSDSSFCDKVVNLDALTYAGNPKNQEGLKERHPGRYLFRKADIRDFEAVKEIFELFRPDAVVHFAAESHVDRSIVGPGAFVETNVLGTYNLLQAARNAWGDRKDVVFHHVSTDEVFGSLGDGEHFTEESRYDPRSPYSASKAASDHLVRAWNHTFELPVTITNCSNNYGPYQFPEKLVPLMILNMMEGKPLPVYGDGRNVRDWLYVDDHVEAIKLVMTSGRMGETYAVGGGAALENIVLLDALCRAVAAETGISPDEYRSLITYVQDRPGHDRRYAIDPTKIRSELGWEPRVGVEEGLRRTAGWYLGNPEWVESIRTGAYREWLDRQYGNR